MCTKHLGRAEWTSRSGGKPYLSSGFDHGSVWLAPETLSLSKEAEAAHKPLGRHCPGEGFRQWELSSHIEWIPGRQWLDKAVFCLSLLLLLSLLSCSLSSKNKTKKSYLWELLVSTRILRVLVTTPLLCLSDSVCVCVCACWSWCFRAQDKG